MWKLKHFNGQENYSLQPTYSMNGLGSGVRVKKGDMTLNNEEI